MERNGKLIVIEGLDGSGKATQAALLTEFLQKQDKPVNKISFPDYANPSSSLVRMYLNGEVGSLNDVNVYAASSFYAADRYVSFERFWKKPYQDGNIIIADRYATSNAVHQMAKLPESEWDAYLDWLEEYEYGKLELPRPDIVLYLDMQPETSRALLLKRYGGDHEKRDIHERDFGYLLRCRSAALYAAKKLDWRVIRCCDGSSPLPVEKIAAMIREQIIKGE